ncbi:MAG: asparagine synthase-related protein [Hyphomicrobiaceae bacterium]
MAAPLAQRGPEGTQVWREGATGLGHTLLATTPEAARETLPLRHSETGCVITADVRLDNRAELCGLLDLGARASAMGDGEIILHAYLKWGTDCGRRLTGDFAFIIWDPRERMTLAVRDHFGMRPVNWYQSSSFLAVASEPDAIVALPDGPRCLDRGRIADLLIPELEGSDRTSTFFKGIFRLPPAHMLVAREGNVRVSCYWTPQIKTLTYAKDEDYTEAFLDHFTRSVRDRLRCVGPVGSMLSGGMDSGSVVAVASRLLKDAGGPPLRTYSAIGPDPLTCSETRSARQVAELCPVDASFVSHGDLAAFMPELGDAVFKLGDPFDYIMNLVRAVYLMASRQGTRIVLDGVAGDIVLNHGSYPRRLFYMGRWAELAAIKRGLRHFWGESLFSFSVGAAIRENVRTQALFKRFRPRLYRRWTDSAVSRHAISAQLAEDARLPMRYQRLQEALLEGRDLPYPQERICFMKNPYLAVGCERYDRVASRYGIERRDPFLDRALVEFCLSLPGSQLIGTGWPKFILRRAMVGRLPNETIWKPGRAHLGWTYTQAVAASTTVRKILQNRDLRIFGTDLIHTYTGREDCIFDRLLYKPIEVSEDLGIVALAYWLYQNNKRGVDIA